MPAPIDSETIIAKLLEKTEAGRVEWRSPAMGRGFQCFLDETYKFEIIKSGDIYTITMKDGSWNEIFVESIQEQLIYERDEDRRKFDMLRDLYELARRDALDVEKKVADVSNLLDKI